jgi:hypothetical protein
MDEYVLSAILRRDEAESLVIVEKLHSAGSHLIPLPRNSV